ncbi:MAG: acetyltransferase [Sphingomonadales bacterium]|nr:MAG: acetyltransferase [Sphingomonadales bacterium]
MAVGGRLAIFGAGGFGREVLRIARQSYGDVVFVDDQPLAPVLGAEVIMPAALRDSDELVVTIGNSQARRSVTERFAHLPAGTIRAPSAIIGDDVEIGAGAVFCDFTAVTGAARIGRGFQCNFYSYVAHDCVIGDFVTFGARVSCNANVVIGDGAQLASGVLIQCGAPDRPVRIGAGAHISAGTLITQDVPPNARI